MSQLLGLSGAIPIGPSDIAAAEARLGFALPPVLAAFCLRENGGMPARSWLLEGGEVEYRVDAFFPVEPMDDPAADGIVAVYQQFAGEGVIPASSLPFAHDAGSNPFLLDRDTGRVWFMPMDEWEHEETPEQNWARSGRTLAASFEAFVDALTDAAPDWARD